MRKVRILGAGVVVALTGVLANGCYTQEQPLAECNVQGPQNNVYLALLTNPRRTGACTGVPSSELDHFELSALRFSRRGSTFESWEFYFRLGYLLDVYGGGAAGYGPAPYRANADLTNDCTATTSPGKCVACVTGTAPNLLLPDGGTAVESGVTAADGGLLGVAYSTLSDGGVQRVNLANRCGATIESFARRDPTDPTGAKIDLIGKPTAGYPDSAGVCRIGNFTGGIQNLAEIPDAGFPAIQLKAELSNVELLQTPDSPGTYFTAGLKFIEGSCTTDYDMTAFWPALGCETDGDCDPKPDVDAGEVFGSGILPALKPVCNTDIGFCVPTVSAADLRNK